MPRRERGLHRRADRRPGHARHERAVPHVHEPRRVSPAAARGQRRPAPDADRPRARPRRRRALGILRSQARPARARKSRGFNETRIKAADIPAEWQARVLGESSTRDALPRSTCCAGRKCATSTSPSLIGEPDWMRAAMPTTVCRSRCALQLEVAAKYSGYIERQEEEIARQRRNEETRLPDDLDYARVAGCRTKCGRSSRRSARPRSDRPRACRASRRPRFRSCSCTSSAIPAFAHSAPGNRVYVKRLRTV